MKKQPCADARLRALLPTLTPEEKAAVLVIVELLSAKEAKQ